MALRPLALAALLVSAVSLTAGAVVQTQVATTLNDFRQPGTQPGQLLQPIATSGSCTGCHSGFDPQTEPYEHWAASMMGQAGRDPIFYAALAIANQDAANSGEWCLRCHAPGAWLDGRSTPSDGSALDNNLGDLDGVTCNLCHRMVDPVYDPGHSPASDYRILDQLAQRGGIPPTPNNGQYVIDPLDRRRAPFDLGPNFFYHDWEQSPYHRESLNCGTCHELSNPTQTKQPDGSFALNALDAPHPTHNKYDEFPIERTYSEWEQSRFADGPVEMGARFGGNRTSYSSCQDCHMPKVTGGACQPVLGPVIRDDLPQHNFNGVNSWVLRAVRSLYPDYETGLTAQSVADAAYRTEEMHRDAVDVSAWASQGNLRVRLVNQTGHKLPTGYGEGRRMWIHVVFKNAANQVIAERGAYDGATATLTTTDTKVYEIEQGVDAAQAAATGLPVGKSFRFVLNNKIYSDNRIPPRGFTNVAFDAIDAEPVAYSYADEQYWDDTAFAIPPGAASAVVEVFHQTTTREYIEFLRDSNVTNGAGLLAYNQWVLHGKSAPILKGSSVVNFAVNSCVPPIQYGAAKRLSNGRTPALAWSGVPSVSGVGFAAVVRNGLPNSYGALRAAPATASVPFQGGTLLLGGPITNVVNFVLDGTGQALLPIAMAPGMVGVQTNYQAFFRDRGVVGGTAITNGLHVQFCP
ncbi:MAG: multiheme c-type cytochrome [Planctomycetota bacterium]|nr:multiheme c-type cytochrome [Planctomycetota bacterium]